MDELREYLGGAPDSINPVGEPDGELKELAGIFKNSMAEDKLKVYFLLGYDLEELKGKVLKLSSAILESGTGMEPVTDSTEITRQTGTDRPTVYVFAEWLKSGRVPDNDLIKDSVEGKYFRKFKGSVFVFPLLVDQYRGIFEIEDEASVKDEILPEVEETVNANLVRGFAMFGISFAMWAIIAIDEFAFYLGVLPPYSSLFGNIYTYMYFLSIPLTGAGLTFLVLWLRNSRGKKVERIKILWYLFVGINLGSLAYLFLFNGMGIVLAYNRFDEYISLIYAGVIFVLYGSVYFGIPIAFSNLKRKIMISTGAVSAAIYLYSVYSYFLNSFGTIFNEGSLTPLHLAITILSPLHPMFGIIYGPPYEIYGINSFFALIANAILSTVYIWTAHSLAHQFKDEA